MRRSGRGWQVLWATTLVGGLATVVAPAALAQCPASAPTLSGEVGNQFPGPPVRQDLRESLAAQKDCLRDVRPRRLSKQELQEIRRAVRAQAKYNRVGPSEPTDR